jgi:RHS repeat-associated protein
VNEIDTDNSDGNPAGNSISGSGGADWIDPVSDKAGNLTVAPRVGQEASASLTLTYDGWNRMVKVQAGAAVVGEYQYDARNRRVAKLVPNGANWDRTDYYYTCGWQTIEERQLVNTPSKTAVATVPRFQWIWDLRYIDAVVLRDENKDGDTSCTGASDQRLYYTQDPNWNTTALVNAAGVVQERYTYDAYGAVTVLNGAWGAQTVAYNNEIRFAGYRQDAETGLYLARNRYYHPTLGRWTRRDPISYEAGSSLYRYCWDNPGNFVDSMGLDGKKETKTFYYTAGKSETWRRKDEPNKDKPYETYLHTITVTVDATSCKKGCVSCSGTPKASIDFESTVTVARLGNAGNIRRAGLYINDKYYNSDEKGKSEKLAGSTFVASAPGVFETNCDNGKIEQEFMFILKPKEGEKETKDTVLAQSYLLNLKATVDECGEKITIDLTMNFVNPKAIEGEGRLLKPIKDPNDPGRYPKE